jgi:hypothetical protein
MSGTGQVSLNHFLVTWQYYRHKKFKLTISYNHKYLIKINEEVTHTKIEIHKIFQIIPNMVYCFGLSKDFEIASSNK